jgi:mannan endo-1,4-beta-mannosidase
MRLRSLLATAAACAVAGTTVLTTAPAAQASAPPVLFGLISPWSGSTMTTPHDDSQLGIHSGIIGSFFHWEKQVPTTPFTNWLSWVHARGAVPMPDLYPPSTVTLGQIAAGSQDRYLKPLAVAMRDWGNANRDARGLASQVLFRLLPEMNGNWESYAPRTRGQTAAQFRAAWIHVVNIFRNAGASNVKFVWNPDRIYKGSTSIKSLWPGSAYVDWVAWDAYNWADKAHGTHTSPYELLRNSVSTMRTFTSKPMLIAELGTAPYRGKSYFLSHMVSAMQKLGAKGLVYFDKNMQKKWRFDTATSHLKSAKTAVHASNATWLSRVSFAQINHWAASGGSYN